MATQSKPKRKGWPVVGTLRKGDNGNYIKLADNVKILVDGEEIALNKSRTVNLKDPRQTVKDLFDRGHITEEEHDKRLEKLSGMAWLRYELQVPPPRED
jgi:hypothetical protein